MRLLVLGLVGLALGAAAGFWIGLMLGLIYAEAAKISCLEGACGFVAIAIALAAAALLGLVGAVMGVRRAA